MADGKVSAIELKGIVRNRTKIGVEDGMAEDLINLRFVDGSWRTSGDGRHVYSMTENENGLTYTKLYVHTNIYRHLLGVRDGRLWWFASINTDGVTFTPLSTPEEIGTVSTPTDISYSQVGHLLTYISGGQNASFLFSEHKGKYIKKHLDYNGLATDEFLAPVGQIDIYTKVRREQHYTENSAYPKMCVYRYPEPPDLDSSGYGYDDSAATKQLVLAGTAAIRAKLEENNSFHFPFLAVVAYELYDGSYIAASAPKLVIPNEYQDSSYCNMAGKSLPEYRDNNRSVDMIMNTYPRRIYVCPRNIFTQSGTNVKSIEVQKVTDCYHKSHSSSRFPTANPVIYMSKGTVGDINIYPNQIMYTNDETLPTVGSFAYVGDKAFAMGTYNDLYLKCGRIDKSMEGIITNICVFISPWIHPYKNITGTDGVYTEKPYYFRLYDDEYETVYNHVRIRKNITDIQDEIANSTFYLYKRIDFSTITESEIKLEVEDGILKNIVQQTRLPNEAFDRNSYMAKVIYTYNSRLHMANYARRLFQGYPISSFQRATSVKGRFESSMSRIPVIKVRGYEAYTEAAAIANAEALLEEAIMQYNHKFGGVRVTIKDAANDVVKKVSRYLIASDLMLERTIDEDTDGDDNDVYICTIKTYTSANMFETLVSYPDTSATLLYLNIGYINVQALTSTTNSVSEYKSNTVSFTLKPMLYYNLAFALSLYSSEIAPIDKKITFSSGSDANTYPTENIDSTYPNAMRVSKTDQPMFFPVENTYQVGSAEILALCSNAIAVGTGQTGDAPLYVFCADGVYGLFVDDTGQMAYPNARPLTGDVINNKRSVTKTDLGVAFTTDRGLMMMVGEKAVEIGQPAEGDVLQFFSTSHADYIKTAKGALEKVADLPTHICDATDFLTYLKNAIVSYNHNERELIISNPAKKYSYVLDRENQWSRRDYSADEYVNNYPTSYRVYKGEFYKLDEEGFSNTSLEQKKEAPNDFFYLSNIIKLDSIGFKEAHRFVVRGYFETQNTRFITSGAKSGTDSIGSIPIIETIFNISTGINKLPGLRTIQQMRGRTFRMTITNNGNNTIQMGVGLKRGIVGDIWAQDFFSPDVESEDSLSFEFTIPTSGAYLTGAYIFIYSGDSETPIGSYDVEYRLEEVIANPHVGCYVLGSYDGRKWARLGGNERTGKFTNIGCLVERTDVRFLRVCLAGQVTGKTRIEYMEISANPSVLNTKIR